MIHDSELTSQRPESATTDESRPAFHASRPFLVGACLLVFLLFRVAHAFPPAPHHVIHGVVRDEFGDPISLSSARVFLQTTNGVSITCQISPGILPGENYRLLVPMDSLTAPDTYKSVALHATIPFRLKVLIGTTTYVPIEMAGDMASLGQPAGDTVINLTLGIDSDGDGLPDAWEYALMQMLGGGLTLANITRNGDDDGDGISNYDEYVAGTYAFDPQDGLKLKLVRRGGQGPVVQFFGIAGRTYTVSGTTNLAQWSPVTVRVPAGDTNNSGAQQFYNSASRILEAEVLLEPSQSKSMFFRVHVN